jgi:trimeric autotransporter adhesin
MNQVIQQSQTGKKTRGVFLFRLWIGFLIYLMGGFPTLVFALPQDGQVVSGSASITTSGSDMVVHQTTDKLITNWQSFNIGAGELVDFRQPNASSIALNNVVGLSPSLILGSLKSNGQVFISNGSGVIFGQSAQVNVGGLLATTLSITNQDFEDGNYNFTQDSSRPLSSVVNRGLIKSSSYVGLLAPVVENYGTKETNTGIVVANMGSVALASGKAASLDFIGDGLINFAITEAVDGDVLDDEGNVIGHRVKNAGLVKADGGRVVLSARDAGNVIQNVVNNTGIIEAHSAVERNGEIFLMGGDSGVVANSGTLDASGKESGQTGGTVHMVGEKVGVFGEGVVDVSGNAGGGTALIGGDVQGGGDVQTATNTYVSEDATVTADAIENGDGGKVVVWADDTARIYGSVSATGGSLSGDGGFVETSGKNFLEITRAADVSAAFGLGGEWLIDPRDITIVDALSGPTTGINTSNPFVSTGDSSILVVDLIIAALVGGSNVTITTGSDGAQAGDITLNTDLDFDGTGVSTLSFIAHNDIVLNGSILDSSAGDGDMLNLVFTADSDLNGSGNLVVDALATVGTQGGTMQITARDVDIQGILTAEQDGGSTGDITISLAGAGQIVVGDAAYCPTCTMAISGQEIQNIRASNLIIENSADAIFLDDIVTANIDEIGRLVLDAGGDIDIGQFTGDNIDMFSAGTITINDVFFAQSVANLNADNGIVLNADFTANSLTLDGDANSSVDGIDQVTISDGVTVAAFGVTGPLTIHKAEALGKATLNSANGINMLGDFTAHDVLTINADTKVLVQFGTLHIANGVTVDTNNNDLLIQALDLDLQGIIDVGSANATISVSTGGVLDKIQIGDATLCSTCAMFISGAELENIFANTLTIENTAQAIFVDNVTAANSENIGTVILSSAKHIRFYGAESTFNALTATSATDMDVLVNVSTDTGDLILNGDSDVSGGSDRFLLLSDRVLTSAGDIVLTFSGSAGTIDASADATLDAAGSIIVNAGLDVSDTAMLTAGGAIDVSGAFNADDLATLTAGTTITLGDSFTSGGDATLNANDGINVNGDFTASGNIVFNADANSSVDGNDTLTLANGVTVESTGGSVSFDSATSALGSISVLALNGIDVNGAFASLGATVFDADSDSNSAGNFTVSATGSVATNNNTLSIKARDVDLQGALNAGAAGDIVLTMSGTGHIQLGDSTLCSSCPMQISGAELENMTAATLTVDNLNGAIFVDNVTALNSQNIGAVTLNSGKHLSIRGNASTFNALTANATTDMDVFVSVTTVAGDLILNGDTDASGGNRFLLYADPILVSAGDIVLTSGSGGAIDASIAAVLNAVGSITIDAGLDVVGAAMLTAGSAINVTGAFNAGDLATLTAGTAITLGNNFTSGGDATLNANDGINVNGDFTASGNIVFNADANSSVDGNDTLAIGNGVTIESTGGSVSFDSAVSALGSVSVLALRDIDVNGAFISLGATVFDADSDSDSSGDFTVSATGSVATNNNTLSIKARDVDLQGTLNAGAAGDIVLTMSGTGNIQLGDSTLCPSCPMQISGAELENITAATLTVDSSNGAIFVDNVTATNSGNIGAVTLNSGRHLSFRGNASTFNALTANATTDMDVFISLTTVTGDLILTGDSDASGGSRFLLFSDPVLTSAGDIVLTSGSGGTIDASVAAVMGAAGSIVINADLDVVGAAMLTAGGSITLGGDFTAGDDVVLTGATGINVNGFFTGDDSVTLDADGAINVAGDLTASDDLLFAGTGTAFLVDNAILTSANGSLTVNNVTAAGAVTLNASNGINLNGAFTSLGATVFDADSDSNSAGDFTVSATGSVATNNNTLSIKARDVDLQGTLNAGVAGDIVLTMSGTGNIQLGDSTLCPTCPMQISGAELENITAATLTVDSSNGAIFVDNVTATNSGNIGAVTLNSGRHLSFRGNASTFNALTANATTDMDVFVSVTTVAGDLILTGDSDASGGSRFLLFSDPVLTSAGDIVLTSGSGGTIDASVAAVMGAAGSIVINAGLDVVGAAMLTAGGSITLGGDFEAGGDATLNADDGITVSGAFTATDNIILNGDANSSVDGNDTVTLASGITVESTAGSVSFDSATSALSAITVLAANGIDINDAFTSLGLTTFNSDTDSNGAGAFAVAGSVLTNDNTLNITADDFVLTGTLNAGLSDITILVSDNGTIGLGNTVGDMTIDGSELQNIFAANLILGNTSNGDVTVDGIIAANSQNIGTVTLNSGGDINFSNNDSVFNALNLNAVTDINVNTNLETVTGDFVAVADVELNNVGDFNLGTGNTVTSANDIDIAGENIGLDGNLVAGGTITLNGVLLTGSGIVIQAADGITIMDDVFNSGDITIDADTDRNGVGDFEIIAGKIIKSFGNNISITANDFIIDGLIDAGSGTLTLLSSVAGSTIGLGNAAGSIQISGAELQNMTAANLIVGSSLNSGVAVDGVTASDLVNIDSVSLNSGGDINFNNNDSTFNALTLVSGGSINSAAATIFATALSTSSVSGTNITTQVSSLDFANSGSGDVTVNNSGSLSLAGSNSADNLFIATSGAVTQSAALAVSGSTTINAAGFDVTLNDGSNDFTGSVSIAGANVDLTNIGAVDLGASTVTGNLNLVAGGAVTQFGSLSVTGTTILNASGFDVTLNDAGNNFNGTITVTGANVSLAGLDGITLGTSTITGDLTVAAVNGVTVEGVVTTSGVTSIDADSNSDSSGDFTVLAAGSVATNNNTLTINARNVDLQGTLNAGVAGDIVLSISGTGHIQLGDSNLCPSCPMQISGAELENMTAATLTISNSNGAIFVDNVTAADSENIGAVILDSFRHIRFYGNESTFNALTATSATDMDVLVNVSTDTGDLILNGDSDVSGGSDRFLLLSDRVLTSAGDIVLTFSGSAGTIDASADATLDAGGSIIINAGLDVDDTALLTAGGSITLDGDFAAGFDATLNADDGITINGAFTARDNIVLNADANTSADGNDTITLADGITVESTVGSVSFDSATSALGVITVLAANGIDINDAFISLGLTTFNSDTDSNGTGTFTVAGSVLTNGNRLNITADDIDLTGTLNAGAGDIEILVSDDDKIGLGNASGDMKISGSELQNITAETLFLGYKTPHANSNGNIRVDGITETQSDNIGTLALSTGGSVTFVGAGSTFNALTVDADEFVTVLTDLTTTGDMILRADVDSSGAGFDRIIIQGDSTLTSGGNLFLSASNGTSAGGGIDVLGGVSLVAAGTITLNNDFDVVNGDAILNADDGINVNGSFTVDGNIAMNGDANGLVDGNDTIALASGITVGSATGSISFDSAVSALGAITVLAVNGIDINDAFTSLGLTTFNSDSDANGTGTFMVGAVGSVTTNNNVLSITANDIDLTGTLNAGNSDITILVSDNGTIGLGNAFGDMTIDGSEMQNITAANLTIGNATNGSVTVDGVTAANSDNIGMVMLNSGGSVEFSGSASTFNALAVGQSSVVNVNATLSTDTGALDLTSGSDININANVTSATTSSLIGESITTTAATITATSLTTRSTSGTNISTQVASLDFFNAISGDVVVNNSGALSLSGTGFSGSLSVTADGAITQGSTFADRIWVVGDMSFNAAGQDITLTNGSNILDGSISLIGNNVDLAGVTDFGASTISGSLSATSGRTITDSGPITVAGTTTLVTTIASKDVILDNAGNDFGGAVSVNSRNVTLVDQNAIDIGTSQVEGTFSVTAGGAVTDSGVLFALGDTNINAAGNDVTLDGFVFFGGAVSVAGANVTLIAQTSIDLGASTITGNLNVTTEDGAVTQSGALTVAGTTDIDADGFAVYDVTLNTLGNDFGGAVSITGKDVSLFDSNDIDFGASMTTGTFNVLAGGDITQSGALNIAGDSSLAGVNITLNNASNDFIGTVSASGSLLGGNVSLTDINAINLGTSNTNGDYMITAGGAVTQSGALSVTGMTMISAIGNDVTLNNASNDFVGEVGIDANNVSITDINSITFKASTLSGGLTVNANDGVTINGAVSTGAASAINADNDANGSGNFAVTAAGSILTNNNTLSITADDFDLQGTLNAGLSDITVFVSDNGTIGLGNTAGDMTIDGSELQNITATNLILGSTTNGNVTVDGISAANSDNIGTVTLASGGNIDFSNNDSVFNALNIHAVTDINVNTNLETDTGNFAAIADFENNTIGDFNLGTGTTVTSAVDIDITAENVNLNGNLTAGGTITINGVIFIEDNPIFLSAADGIIITEDIDNNESITIDADSNNDGIGDFELVGGVLIKSNDYDISITANDFIINGTIDAGTGNVNLFSSVGGSIGVGEADGDIEIDNSELQNITAGNLNIGDELNGHIRVKNVQTVDVANIAKLTLNATKAGKSVTFQGAASNLNDLTVNASNDVKVKKGLTAKETSLNAGDDVKLKGNLNFDSLNANAGDDIHAHGTLTVTGEGNLNADDDIHLHGDNSFETLNAIAGDDIHAQGTLTVSGDGNLNADDDIHLHGNISFDSLNAIAEDDIHAHGTLTVTSDGNLNAGDDIHLHGDNSFGTLNVSAVDDIKVHEALTVAGNTFMTAGDDIDMRGTFNLGDWAAVASDDIKLRGDFNVSAADLKANDEIKIEKAEINSGNFSAEADFDNNGAGAFKLDKKSSITSSDDIDLSGYKLKIKGSLTAAGTLTLTDKSE